MAFPYLQIIPFFFIFFHSFFKKGSNSHLAQNNSNENCDYWICSDNGMGWVSWGRDREWEHGKSYLIEGAIMALGRNLVLWKLPEIHMNDPI